MRALFSESAQLEPNALYCLGAVVALVEVAPVPVPAVFVVRAVVVLAVVALIFLGVPFSVAALSGVLGFVVGVAALLGPLLCAAVVLIAVLLVVIWLETRAPRALTECLWRSVRSPLCNVFLFFPVMHAHHGSNAQSSG